MLAVSENDDPEHIRKQSSLVVAEIEKVLRTYTIENSYQKNNNLSVIPDEGNANNIPAKKFVPKTENEKKTRSFKQTRRHFTP